MTTLKYGFIIVLLFAGFDLFAQTSDKTITTAVPFLQISTDAKSSGMGSAGIATGADISAVYWNIAKLPFSSANAQINCNYSPWLKEWSSDMYLASLAGFVKFNNNEAIHAGIKYFNPGNLDFTDNNGNHLQSYHPYEFEVQAGYSRKISDHFGIGTGIEYIRSDLAGGTQNEVNSRPGNAVALDLGFYYDLKNANSEGWSFGATLSNLGSKISYTNSADDKAFIPANLGLGTSFTKVFDEQNKLTLALDVNKLLVPKAPSDSIALVAYRNKSVVGSWFSSFSDGSLKEELNEFQISLGAEYWYDDIFAIRAGYFYENKNNGNRKHFSAGASLKYNLFTANFSYLAPSSSAARNPLSNTLLFGVTIDLKN